MLQTYHFTSFFLKIKSNLLVKRFFLLLNAASAMAVLDLISRVHLPSSVVQYLTNRVAWFMTLCRKNFHTAIWACREQNAEKNVQTKNAAKFRDTAQWKASQFLIVAKCYYDYKVKKNVIFWSCNTSDSLGKYTKRYSKRNLSKDITPKNCFQMEG